MIKFALPPASRLWSSIVHLFLLYILTLSTASGVNWSFILCQFDITYQSFLIFCNTHKASIENEAFHCFPSDEDTSFCEARVFCTQKKAELDWKNIYGQIAS